MRQRLVRLILVLLSLLILTGCSRSRPIHYVMPEEYRGPFWMVDEPNAPPLPVVGGGWIQITVPAKPDTARVVSFAA